MAEEITYIPYGQDEISQQELQTALANDLPDFTAIVQMDDDDDEEEDLSVKTSNKVPDTRPSMVAEKPTTYGGYSILYSIINESFLVKSNSGGQKQ